jgi:hypothetical protein
MNAAIVDTDVVSMLFRGDTRALAWRPHINNRGDYSSVDGLVLLSA